MAKRVSRKVTIGLDLGDRHSQLYALDADGECIEEARLRTTTAALERRFCGAAAARIVIEAGTHSPWVSRLLSALGHEVIVANPRKLRLIYENDSKDDRVDAEYLARVGRLDPKLLAGIEHRGEEAQVGLAVVRSRDVLVRSRTQMINHARGVVKSLGLRLPSCSAPSFANKVRSHVPDALREALDPILDLVAELTRQIRAYDKAIEKLCEERYPETALMRQVKGVGALTSLTYTLIIEDPKRFRKSRTIGAYVGLIPRRAASGASDPQMRITKAGNPLLRRLLVQSAQYILGPKGSDCDLRRFGERIAARGGKNARKRAVVAVARKLSVLLHRLWVTAEVYEPLRASDRQALAA